ncbi:MAG: hypothetical protein AcusKO_44520 [Acuticoccus sp.]
MDISIVNERFGHLKYMSYKKAQFLHKFCNEHDIDDVLELGFFHGKSSAFFAAIMEEKGSGHVHTFDLKAALKKTPPIEDVLRELDLSHRVTPVYCHRSFTWEMGKLIEKEPLPQYDLCYIDGAHTWDGTGFSFFLVDILLKPGGWVLFDDLDWSIAASPHARQTNFATYQAYDEEEREAMQVRKVWEVLVPQRGYTDRQEFSDLHWGLARKPLAGNAGH